MHPLTLTGLMILTVVVLAVAGGASTSGATRLGREIGFVLGLLAGLAIGLVLAPHMVSRPAVIVLLLGATIGGGLIGAGLLGGVGKSIAQLLHGLELGSLDRALGALLSGIGAVAICALVLHLAVLFAPHSSLTRDARHDVVAQWLLHNPLVMLL